jgi:integration host factor subunit alpha
MMTKADIAAKIAEQLNFTKKESEEITELVLEVMKRVLVADGKLKISGFGNFEVKRKKDRRGRNPQTGEEMTITARKILTYHPSVVLKNKLNGVTKQD